MSHCEGTFERYEMKYLLSETKYTSVRLLLQNKLNIDNFGKTTICNIYFDTPNHLLIRNSLEKPIYKEKLRLRSYGTPTEQDKVFVELKKKYDGIVYKRRVKMELTTAQHYLYDAEVIREPSQITKEIDWFLRFYKDIKPSMYISYNRIAMYGVEDPELRVTFDSNLLWREDDLWLGSGTWGSPLFREKERLMEIKIPGSMPLWLSHILDELEIYPTSFSKYGTAYLKSEQLKKCKKTKGEIKYA
jgi:SPX domain protein involved in polyphosphate accumulation